MKTLTFPKSRHLYITTFIGLSLTACSGLPPAYVYSGDDAATIYLSLTNSSKMSELAAWGIQITPEDQKLRDRLSNIGIHTSSRIYGWRPAHLQFDILQDDEYGNSQYLFKLPPGKYRITSITTSISLNGPFYPQIIDNDWASKLTGMAKPAGAKSAKRMSPIIIDVIPGFNYIGSFKAIKNDCNKTEFKGRCNPLSVEISDKFSRDTDLVKAKLNSTSMNEFIPINRTLRIRQSTESLVHSTN